MIYKVKFVIPSQSENIEFYADSYKQISQIINNRYFSGFNIIKTGTIKTSYKKSSKKNHLHAFIPTFEMEKINHTTFDSKEKYHEFRKSLSTRHINEHIIENS